jgi:hypothetical protein
MNQGRPGTQGAPQRGVQNIEQGDVAAEGAANGQGDEDEYTEQLEDFPEEPEAQERFQRYLRAARDDVNIATIVGQPGRESQVEDLGKTKRLMGPECRYPIKVEGYSVSRAVIDMGSQVNIVSWRVMVVICTDDQRQEEIFDRAQTVRMGFATYDKRTIKGLNFMVPLKVSLDGIEVEIPCMVNEQPMCRHDVLIGTQGLQALGFQLKSPAGQLVLPVPQNMYTTAPVNTVRAVRNKKVKKLCFVQVIEMEEYPVYLWRSGVFDPNTAEVIRVVAERIPQLRREFSHIAFKPVGLGANRMLIFPPGIVDVGTLRPAQPFLIAAYNISAVPISMEQIQVGKLIQVKRITGQPDHLGTIDLKRHRIVS